MMLYLHDTIMQNFIKFISFFKVSVVPLRSSKRDCYRNNSL